MLLQLDTFVVLKSYDVYILMIYIYKKKKGNSSFLCSENTCDIWEAEFKGLRCGEPKLA